jgi:hypothetical protein
LRALFISGVAASGCDVSPPRSRVEPVERQDARKKARGADALRAFSLLRPGIAARAAAVMLRAP